MSVPRPKSDVEDGKVDVLSTIPIETENAALPLASKIEGSNKAPVEFNSYLTAPSAAPFRSFSPDTLSILSAEDFEHVQLSTSYQQAYGNDRSDVVKSSRRGWRGKLHAFWTHNKGCAYMLLAQFFGTLMSVSARLLEVEGNNGKGMDPFQILFARMSVTVVVASAWMWYNKTPHFPLGAPEVRWLLFARGFGGFFGVFGMYYSLLYLPLADATVITFLAPGLASWACSILLHEPFTRLERIGSLVSLVGVLLIARPASIFQAFTSSPPASGNGEAVVVVPGNGTASAANTGVPNVDDVTPGQRLGAVGVALLGVLGAATAYTTIKWIGKRAHPFISVNYFAVWCTIVSATALVILPDSGFLLPARPIEWTYLIVLGSCGFIMQCFLVAALSYEKSSRTTNLIYTQMLFALGFDKLIFGRTPGLLSIVGFSLILGSAIVVTARKDSGVKREPEAVVNRHDEESGIALASGSASSQSEIDDDRTPVQQVPLRTLR